MLESFWKISTDTNKKDNCRKIVDQVLSKLNYPEVEVNYESDPESGKYSGSFNLMIDCSSKEELMFEIIRLGQQVGYDWQLNGSIENQTDAHSLRPSISGIVMAEWHVDIPDEWSV